MYRNHAVIHGIVIGEEALDKFMGSQTLENITIDSLGRKLINDVYPTLFHYDITVDEEFSYIIDQLDSHSENDYPMSREESQQVFSVVDRLRFFRYPVPITEKNLLGLRKQVDVEYHVER